MILLWVAVAVYLGIGVWCARKMALDIDAENQERIEKHRKIKTAREMRSRYLDNLPDQYDWYERLYPSQHDITSPGFRTFMVLLTLVAWLPMTICIFAISLPELLMKLITWNLPETPFEKRKREVEAAKRLKELEAWHEDWTKKNPEKVGGIKSDDIREEG